MKHKELIQAALDGKIIQFRYTGGGAADWAGWRSPEAAIAWMAGPGQGAALEVRIKPPEPPKKVHTLYLVGDEVYLNYRSANAVDAALKLELDVREVKITVQGSKIISTEEVKYV